MPVRLTETGALLYMEGNMEIILIISIIFLKMYTRDIRLSKSSAAVNQLNGIGLF